MVEEEKQGNLDMDLFFFIIGDVFDLMSYRPICVVLRLCFVY